MYVTFYLRFISNSVNALIWLGFSINIISTIGAFFLVESPAWLVSVGETKWVEKSMQYMAKFNGKADFRSGNIVPN